MMDKTEIQGWRKSTFDSKETTSHSMIRISHSGRISMKHKSKNRMSLGFGAAADSLLAMLNHPDGVETFRAFLKSEFSEENLDFWLDCERYREITQLKPQKSSKYAHKIYSKYLDSQAPKEINLDAATKAITISKLKSPNCQTFVAAQNHIFRLMESDSYKRFMTFNNNKRWK